MKCRAVSICCFCVCVYIYVCCVFLRPLPTILLNLTRAVSRRNVTLALFFHTQFYKKTKQLPVLMKCCEEIQPHQWKPPVEREEHRLPFWLKVQRSSSVCQEQNFWSLRTWQDVQGLLYTSAALAVKLGLKKSSVTFPLLFLHLPSSLPYQ